MTQPRLHAVDGPDIEQPAMSQAVSPVPDIIAELKAGRMVILVDEEDRENEGDLVVAADFITPDAINFMAKHGRGLICLTLTESRCRQLESGADGQRQPYREWDCVHEFDRSGRRREHRHFGG